MTTNHTPTWAELQDLVPEMVFNLAERYHIDQYDLILIIDTMKTYAAAYHAGVENGTIPQEQQLKHDPDKAIDNINKNMGMEI
jgi:phosphoglycolate phosphatase-like HAD superfamily hydrolase